MSSKVLYHERLSSNRTTLLFVALTAIFFLLFLWRRSVGGMDGWAIGCLVFAGIFLFYVVNYRALDIRIEPKTLTLRFGVFRWAVPVENIEGCQLDEIPAFMRYGGAGIHFMTVHKRYRASFNFLEYPRVVVAFRQKVGPVRDISFSTRRAEEVIKIIRKIGEPIK